MDWIQIISMVCGGGSIVYLLVDRFVRTPQQRGADTADMVSKISDAFSKTLDTTMRYSQEVIDKMKQDDERSEQRYRELETRYDKLERRFSEKETDREWLKGVVSKAIGCKFLKDGRNDDCPVLRENQKRLAAKCRVCADKPEKKQDNLKQQYNDKRIP